MAKIRITETRGRKKNNHSSFLSRVVENKQTGCWEWVGPLSKGYGQFIMGGKWWFTHRYSYQYYKGNLGKLCVCHTCDNPKCVNPDHLFLGTQHDNMTDCKNKGRCRKKIMP